MRKEDERILNELVPDEPKTAATKTAQGNLNQELAGIVETIGIPAMYIDDLLADMRDEEQGQAIRGLLPEIQRLVEQLNGFFRQIDDITLG